MDEELDDIIDFLNDKDFQKVYKPALQAKPISQAITPAKPLVEPSKTLTVEAESKAVHDHPSCVKPSVSPLSASKIPRDRRNSAISVDSLQEGAEDHGEGDPPPLDRAPDFRPLKKTLA